MIEGVDDLVYCRSRGAVHADVSNTRVPKAELCRVPADDSAFPAALS